MPQPCDPQRRSLAPRLALRRPTCCLQIAGVVSEWAHVERTMALMFSCAMGEHVFTSDGQVHAFRDWAAVAVMSTLETLHARVQVIRAALLPRLTPQLVQQWEGLEKELRARAKERNTVAHTAWSISDEYPNDLILETREGRVFRYSERDFADILDRMCEARQLTESFLGAIQAAIRDGSVQLPAR